MKILHIITDLLIGGAEAMLVEVAIRLQRAGHQNLVVSLRSAQPLGDRLRSEGIPVQALDMRPHLPDPLAVFRLAGWMRAERPDIVQTWMYHADLLGGLANLFAGRYPLLWGIHHTAADRTALNPLTYKILRLNALLSRWLPKRIICCAESARDSHIALGYPAGKMRVIPNGIDSQRFQPQAHARASLRKELALPPGASLVGLCARFHPAKDHQTFIEAAALVSQKNPETHFVLCGWQVEGNNPRLSMWIDQAGLRSRCHLLGMRDDMPRILSALDVLVSSSVSEAFPLIVGEAMACGVACVVTNVGDSALLVGNTGQVVPAGDPNSLGEAILSLQGETAVKKGALARKRIMTLYNLEAAVARYIQAYEEIRHANGVA